jgi:hypothetical protein
VATRETSAPSLGSANNNALLKGPNEAAPQVNANGKNLDDRKMPNNHLPTLNIHSANPSDRAM